MGGTISAAWGGGAVHGGRSSEWVQVLLNTMNYIFKVIYQVVKKNRYVFFLNFIIPHYGLVEFNWDVLLTTLSTNYNFATATTTIGQLILLNDFYFCFPPLPAN